MTYRKAPVLEYLCVCEEEYQWYPRCEYIAEIEQTVVRNREGLKRWSKGTMAKGDLIISPRKIHPTTPLINQNTDTSQASKINIHDI